MAREDHDRMGTADLVAGTDHEHQQLHEQQRVAVRREQPQHEPRPHAHPMQQQGQDWQQAAEHPGLRDEPRAGMHEMPPQSGGTDQHQQLAALFPPEVAAQFRQHWDQVQIGFVDDPREAVRHADELVAQVMRQLAGSFADQRARIEAGLGQGEHVETEQLRVALRSYRSFFQRLLAL